MITGDLIYLRKIKMPVKSLRYHDPISFIANLSSLIMSEERRDPDRLDPWDISRGTTASPTSGSPTGYRPTSSATSSRDNDEEPPITWVLVGFFAALLVVFLIALWIVQRCRGDAHPGVVQFLHNGVDFALAALRIILRI